MVVSARVMPFRIWVDTHVHWQRAPRLQAIHTLLDAVGPLTSSDIQERLARASAPAGARMRVTIDTVQRDLTLLIREGYVQPVDLGDKVPTGIGRLRSIWRYRLPVDAL